MLDKWHCATECMCAQIAPRFRLSPEEFIWNGVRTHVNSKEEIPSTGSSEKGRTRDSASRRTASPTHYRLSYSGPELQDDSGAISDLSEDDIVAQGNHHLIRPFLRSLKKVSQTNNKSSRNSSKVCLIGHILFPSNARGWVRILVEARIFGL